MTIVRLTAKQYRERIKKERVINPRLVLCRKCGIPKTPGKCENCEVDKTLKSSKEK